MKKLLFGTAGIPYSAKGAGTEGGIEQVKRLGLDSMELEFVRSVNITKEKAPGVKEAAEKHDVVLTCHAPYFINLAGRFYNVELFRQKNNEVRRKYSP